MGRNVEIKVRVRDLECIRARIEALADGTPEVIEQEDTFFHCPRGRLKLRRFSADRGELISYLRADVAGPRESRFVRSPTRDPASMVNALTDALGVVGVVRKRRMLYCSGQTRIHLDEVDRLGTFLELEVVLTQGQSAEQGEEIARSLMAELAVSEEDLVPRAYIDLLEENR
jgi:predicted adenylyl cyclase CyaB